MNHQHEIRVVIDLRNFTIEKRRDIAAQYEGAIVDIQESWPGAEVGFICISKEQNRKLAFERYERWHDEWDAKNFRLEQFRKHEVVIYDDDDGIPCMNCKGLHYH